VFCLARARGGGGGGGLNKQRRAYRKPTTTTARWNILRPKENPFFFRSPQKEKSSVCGGVCEKGGKGCEEGLS
jgi:hypothetical protein